MCDLVLVGLELGGDVALGVGERLAAGEGVGGALGLGLGEFDVVAEDLVETDLEVGEVVLSLEAELVVDRPLGGVGLKGAGLVERGVDAVADEATFAEVGGRGVVAGLRDGEGEGL